MPYSSVCNPVRRSAGALIALHSHVATLGRWFLLLYRHGVSCRVVLRRRVLVQRRRGTACAESQSVLS